MEGGKHIVNSIRDSRREAQQQKGRNQPRDQNKHVTDIVLLEERLARNVEELNTSPSNVKRNHQNLPNPDIVGS